MDARKNVIARGGACVVLPGIDRRNSRLMSEHRVAEQGRDRPGRVSSSGQLDVDGSSSSSTYSMLEAC